ncbi:oxidoreductase [Alkalihalophilus marmarensis]|uniref:oxidoreductase n=1 Tax=Alkalihalophilus marmarensis TaxID=521377 RepID=UPI002DB5D5C0|nr:NADPH dehydrogenase [Alkalihalophilus marmarensis]MEC2074272.1 NADPH dehydrogenase [Alkalihalophilus marmarensis]
MTNHLIDKYKYKNLELKNRIAMAPMCQYSSKDGFLNEWHFQHYFSRAVGGASLIYLEMTSVSQKGRSTNQDLGLWNDEHVANLKSLISKCKSYGAKVAIQLSHAGRKAEDEQYTLVPSITNHSISFGNRKVQKELSQSDIKCIIREFTNAAKRAVEAGVDMIEIHGAHGYLIHQFHSPITNRREDEYGKVLSKFGTEIIQSIRDEIPKDIMMSMRLSATEYIKGGYDINHIINVAKEYRNAGVDIFSISSGGESTFPVDYPGHHIPFAREFRAHLDTPIIVAGRLDNPILANSVIQNRDADIVAIGRGMLRNPYWSLNAAKELNYNIDIPKQYSRAY